ncbi:MAG TPA: hypothetical protein VI912_03290 [Candidatus Bilamarchaeaceae archaeon]|nr:hypothetical protein [Candidatus Bilamarchaeaceae archaeon]
MEYQKLNLGMTYLLFNKNNEPISYVTLGMGALKIPNKEQFEFRGKKLKEYPKEFPNNFPALLIGKLATNKSQENKGGAGILLDFSVKLALKVRKEMGCAYLIAHVYLESISWYEKKGFRTFISDTKKRDTIPMYLELI